MDIYHQQFLKCVWNPFLIQSAFLPILFDHLTWYLLYLLLTKSNNLLRSSDKVLGCLQKLATIYLAFHR